MNPFKGTTPDPFNPHFITCSICADLSHAPNTCTHTQSCNPRHQLAATWPVPGCRRSLWLMEQIAGATWHHPIHSALQNSNHASMLFSGSVTPTTPQQWGCKNEPDPSGHAARLGCLAVHLLSHPCTMPCLHHLHTCSRCVDMTIHEHAHPV